MMTPWRSRAAKRNLRAGIEKMEEKLTATDKVFRAFRAGRPFKRTRNLFPNEALAEVCTMRDKLRKMLQDAGLNPDDSRVAVVFNIDLDEPVIIKTVPVGQEEEVLNMMLGKYAAVTLGALFSLRDPEREHGRVRSWAHPFIRTPQAEAALEHALEKALEEQLIN